MLQVPPPFREVCGRESSWSTWLVVLDGFCVKTEKLNPQLRDSTGIHLKGDGTGFAISLILNKVLILSLDDKVPMMLFYSIKPHCEVKKRDGGNLLVCQAD